MLFLLILLLSAPAVAQPVEFRPLVEIEYQTAHPVLGIEAAIAFDESWIWVGTPGGLYRLPQQLLPGAAPQLIAFEGKPILDLAVGDGALWVGKETEEVTGRASDHSFLRSTDGGTTFAPVDAALENCFGGFCRFMPVSQIKLHEGRIYATAGGNVVVTSDGGASWTALVGFLEPQACYDPTIELAGDRLLIGGECPLDVAYIRHGTLSGEGTGFVPGGEPRDALTPVLENRNVQFIRRIGDSSIVYAGIEGALLRSTDLGSSFDFVVHYELDSTEKYPYITHLAESDRGFFIAGFDKMDLLPYLATSADGIFWTDLSGAVQAADFNITAFVAVDPSGRLLAGLLDVERQLLRIGEIVQSPPRQRPARRP
jgi:hypothetical protein